MSSDITLVTTTNIAGCVGLCSVGNSVYATSYTDGQVYKILMDGVFTVTQVGNLNYGNLHGIATDSTNLYISAYSSNQVIKCDLNGNVISTIDISPYGSGPTGIFYYNETLFVSLFSSNKIISIYWPSFSTISTLSLTVSGPQSITRDTNGNFYVSEFLTSQVSKWSPTWNLLSRNFIPLSSPTGITFYSNYLFVSSNSGNSGNNIYQYDLLGTQILLFSSTPSPYNILFEASTTPNYYVAASYGNNDASIYSYNSITCFDKSVKILALNNGIEEYVQVNKLKKGDLVKSYLHGYRKIDAIGNGTLYNNPSTICTSMYVLKKTEENELIDDLIITGGHSILVDNLTEDEKQKQSIYWNKEYEIDNKKLLLAGVSSLFKQIKDEKTFTYYHFILENNGDDNERFGVYANGVLVETPCKNTFKNFKINILE